MRKFLALLVLFWGASAFAWDGPPQAPGTSLGNLIHPTNYVDGSVFGLFGPTPFSDSHLKMNLVLLDAEKDTVQFNATGQRFHLDEDLPISGSATTAPRDLWTVNFGATYSHKLKNGDDWGLILSGGSASDHLFNSFHEDTISATATYHYEKDKLHSWIFLLNYGTNRPFAPGVPLPGASYIVINPEAHTVISYGMPFFISWAPDSVWSFSALYFIPTLIHAEADARILPTTRVHFGFDWMPQSWLPANRADTDDRLILDQKKFSVGIKPELAEDLFLDFSAGYAFGQELFLAESLFSSGITKTPLSSAPFVQGEIAYKF